MKEIELDKVNLLLQKAAGIETMDFWPKGLLTMVFPCLYDYPALP